MNLLSFNLADKEYALNIESVREVRRIKNITPIPKALDFIEGVVSMKGHVVPIINLRKKLGLPGQDKRGLNRVIITESGNHVLGLIVDNVIGVISLGESDIEPPDDILRKAGYLVGVGKLGKRLILIADVEKLLSIEDISGIAEVHSKVEIKKR